jgi:hypothetical protein
MVAPLGCAGKEPTKMQVLAQAARPVIDQKAERLCRHAPNTHAAFGAHAREVRAAAQRPCTGAAMTRDRIKIPKLPRARSAKTGSGPNHRKRPADRAFHVPLAHEIVCPLIGKLRGPHDERCGAFWS